MHDAGCTLYIVRRAHEPLRTLNRTTRHSYTHAASCEVSVGVVRVACSAVTAAVTSGV